MMELSPANYRDLKASSTSFAALAAYSYTAMNLVGEGTPQRIEGASVTGNLFPTLGRPAWIGRYFSDHDDQASAPGTVVLSYALWRPISEEMATCWEGPFSSTIGPTW